MWDKGVRFHIQRAILTFAALCCLAPVAYLLIGSLRSGSECSLSQYENILLGTKEYFTWYWNSFKYTLAILILGIPVSVFAAYGFSWYRFRGKDALFFLYILLMLLPFQATAVSQYLTLRSLGIVDTPWAVILPCAYGSFWTVLLTQFMKGIDAEILEAAKIDGAGSLRILFSVVLPLCRPAVASLFILQLISCWSMVDQPLLFMRSEELLPLSLRLNGSSFGQSAFAAGVIYAVLPMLAYLYCQDALERGIRLSSVK